VKSGVQAQRGKRAARIFARALSVHATQKNDALLLEWLMREIASDPALLPSIANVAAASLKQSKGREKIAKAERILRTFIHVCERFGAFRDKERLEDRCFAIIDPDSCQKVQTILTQYASRSKVLTKRIQKILEEILMERGIAASITGRFKSAYSIHRKLQKKREGHPLALHDIFAFRVIVESDDVKECIEVLSILHDRFSPMPERFKDYCSIPKVNGYQSLHTCLKGIHPDIAIPVELQIRTKRMHEVAEEGIAGHWFYAQKKHSSLPSKSDRRLIELFSAHSEANDVICFSIGGDGFRLPQRSTVLDFAYAVHSGLGAQARSAKVNGNLAPLDAPLHDGDCIEIFRKSTPHGAWRTTRVSSPSRTA
jgi:GTP pyrophosphokinase